MIEGDEFAVEQLCECVLVRRLIVFRIDNN
jgi:hypothetical protein